MQSIKDIWDAFRQVAMTVAEEEEDFHLTEALLKSMRRLHVHRGASITPETDLLPQ